MLCCHAYLPSFSSCIPVFFTNTVTCCAATAYQHDRAWRLVHIHTDTTIYQCIYDGAGNRTGLASNTDDYDFDGMPDSTEDSRCTSTTSGDTDNDSIVDT